MDPYEQYLADYEYENYLNQFHAENATNRATEISAPFAKSQEPLGPDMNQSFGQNVIRGAGQAPRALWDLGSQAIDFAQAPIQTIQDAGAEKTAQTVGGLAAGTAGAAALAPWGAELGTAIWPGVGTIAGGTLAGAAGFGGGLLGFDLATDLGSDAAGAVTPEGQSYLKPTEYYLHKFGYDLGQGVATGAITHAATAPFKAASGIADVFSKEGGEIRAAKRLDQLEPGYAGKIDQALATGERNPLSEMASLGELIDSDVLKNAERTIARLSPENYGRSAEKMSARNDAQLRWLDQIEQSDMTPADVQTLAQEGIQNKLALGQQELSAAEEAVRAKLGELAPRIDVSEAGGIMRGELLTGKESMRGQVQKAFEGIGEGVVDPTPALETANKLMPQYFKEVGAQPNSELVTLINSLSREAETSGLLDANGRPITKPATYTMQDVQALRSQALKIAQKGDPRSARVAGEIAESLKVVGDNAVQSGAVSPQEAASWIEGIAKRKEQGAIYESSATPTKGVLAKQPYGEFKIAESAIPSKFFKPGERGAKEAIQNYKRATGGSEQAMEPLYRYATDSFRQMAVDESGLINSKRASTWLRDYAASLNELPELKRILSDADQSQRFLNEKYGDLKRTKLEVENSALQYFLKADPEKAIGAMLSGDKMVKRTISTVDYLRRNSPEALSGLRRGVIEHLKAKAFKPTEASGIEDALVGGERFKGKVLGGTLVKELDRIRPALERSGLFTKSQLKGFDILYQNKNSQLSVEAARMPAGSDTVQNLTSMQALMQAGAKGFLRHSLAGYGRFLGVIEPIIKAIPESQFRAAFEEALLNPRYARDLMNKANARNIATSAEIVFSKQFEAAFGTSSPLAAFTTAAKIGGPMVEMAIPKKEKKIQIPKQYEVTAQKSFPTPAELMSPVAKGQLRKSSFNLDEFIASQSPEVQAGISVESNGDPTAISPKGAAGLMQLMPSTAQGIARDMAKATGNPIEVYRPLRAGMSEAEKRAAIDQNVRFGEFYYKQQLKKYGGDKTLAWAAYNAGPGAVDEAIKMAGSARDHTKVLDNLPTETRDYVKKLKRAGAIPDDVSEVISRLGIT